MMGENKGDQRWGQRVTVEPLQRVDAYIWIIRAWTHIVNKTNQKSFYKKMLLLIAG